MLKRKELEDRLLLLSEKFTNQKTFKKLIKKMSNEQMAQAEIMFKHKLKTLKN
tara:strand:+ start:778 stop:936 length:159 start_codon:yes stop_codon:yes gene_type:complete